MIFITGATGLIGSTITKKLLEKGKRVRALKRKDSNLSLLENLTSQIDWIEGDILDTMVLEKAMEGVTHVVHAAAVVSYAPNRHQQMFTVNVEGTRNVVNTCLRLGIQKLIHISSIASLGRNKQQEEIDEKSEWKESDYNTFYAQTKYFSELEAWRGVEEGLNTVILNPSIVIGAGDWEKSSTKILKYAFEEKKLYPPGNLNYVDARDIADITVLMLENNIVNERYIINADSVPYKIFLDKAAEKFNKKAPTVAVSNWMSALAWRWEKIKYLITGKEPLITKETVKLSRNSTVYNNQKLVTTLLFRYRSLEETLDWACTELTKAHNQPRKPLLS